MTATSIHPPPVMWAQRKTGVFLTICLEDCKDPSIELKEDKVLFKGVGGTDKKEYALDLELYDTIEPEKSSHKNKGRVIEFELKKAKESFWPRLTKGTDKKHWLKVDFSRWKDEDDSEDEAEGGMPGMGGMGGMPGMGGMGGMPGMGGMGGGTDFEEMMRQMGGLSGGGLGGMGGGLGEKPSLDDLEKETDSDDEDDELPDLE